jgi:hypothetical protein
MEIPIGEVAYNFTPTNTIDNPSVVCGQFSSLPAELGNPTGIYFDPRTIRFYYESRPENIPEAYHNWCCYLRSGNYTTISGDICKRSGIPSIEIVNLYNDYKNGVNFNLEYHSVHWCPYYYGACPMCIEKEVTDYYEFCETEIGKIYTGLVAMI